MKNIKSFEIWSAVGTIIIGSLLHFIFEWAGGYKPIALIAAVNESTWEHLKLAFWPAIIFSALAYLFLRNKPANFCAAQAVKLVFIPSAIIVLFYGWLAFLPDNFIWDISIFVVAVIVGHIISYVIESPKQKPHSNLLASVLILILLTCFSLFTFYPPKHFLFQDPVEGGYGIPAK